MYSLYQPGYFRPLTDHDGAYPERDRRLPAARRARAVASNAIDFGDLLVVGIYTLLAPAAEGR